MQKQVASRIAARRGMTLSEIMVTLSVLGVIMVGIAGLLNSSWQSFVDLKWQNKVDAEARRALDAMTDSVRMGGPPDQDFYTSPVSRNGNYVPTLYTSGSSDQNIITLGNGYAGFNTVESPVTQIPRLEFNAPPNQVVAYYIKHTDMIPSNNDGVQFRYEYRQAATNPAVTAWTYGSTQDLSINGGDPQYTTKTVYITVTAEYNPYPNSSDSRTYTRTLTGAVTIRSPFNVPVPQT